MGDKQFLMISFENKTSLKALIKALWLLFANNIQHCHRVTRQTDTRGCLCSNSESLIAQIYNTISRPPLLHFTIMLHRWRLRIKYLQFYGTDFKQCWVWLMRKEEGLDIYVATHGGERRAEAWCSFGVGRKWRTCRGQNVSAGGTAVSETRGMAASPQWWVISGDTEKERDREV